MKLLAELGGCDPVALFEAAGKVKLVAKTQLLTDLLQAYRGSQQTFGLAKNTQVDIVTNSRTKLFFECVQIALKA